MAQIMASHVWMIVDRQIQFAQALLYNEKYTMVIHAVKTINQCYAFAISVMF